jgi:DNA-binding transcriptional MerR regulator
MLRYIERAGLLAPTRSPAGYREYDAAELERLRTLRGLLMTFGIELSDVAFAGRMEADPELRHAIREWLEPLIGEPADANAAFGAVRHRAGSDRGTTSCPRLAIPRITTRLETR